ncbi:transcriptional regulator, partial [Ligilactobacillus salivarius]|nr:transcriptional regulator [Gemmiger gallinarum]MBE5068071.1 transcriptional regulator [Ligilactobacillus salivarius]
MTTVKIGIMNRDEFRQRTISIAKGLYQPTAEEP